MTLDTSQVEELIRSGESLKIEFKSEQREPLSDREIYENIVCLANSEGGVLLIGVENDGTVTGMRPRHGTSTDPYRLQAAIFNNTAPPINTRVSLHIVNGKTVLAIEVDAYP
jgi:ATP-dependent DNA helicase RecG